MSNTSHTPGPWKHSSFQVWAQGEAGNTFGTMVASLRRAHATDAVVEADANLIAAAPDLLAALQLLQDAALPISRGGDVLDEKGFNTLAHPISVALAAIAKATQP